ncbi:hypothetical protein WR25_06726 [Diploscapter pachys]|uniref:COMM domain-containing protein 3 n=1 Tax=Diploscapter pachys TaxID=2018661 RepID=A0A2A2KWG1_9BILA|nr:hypothetical protein WR25_06726 [Diploscapter pachys]
MQISKFEDLYRRIDANAKPIDKQTVESVLEYIVKNEKYEGNASVAAFIGALMIEAARENWNKSDIHKKMSSYCSQNEADAVAEVYEKYKTLLQSELRSIKWQPPELVDVRWEVGSTVESMLLGRLNAPTVKLTLDALEADSTSSNSFTITCDVNQFQDLHWKVKEAQNMLKQLKK